MSYELRIFRVVSGEDVIGLIDIGKKYEVKYPKVCCYVVKDEEEYTELLDWLPKDFYGSTEVTLEKDKVLFIAYPNEESGLIYLETLLQEIPKDDIIYDTIANFVETLEQPKVLH